jgi:hypothetical protein
MLSKFPRPTGSLSQNGLLLARVPNGLSAIAGLSPGFAALLISLSFFAESMLLLGGRKNKESLGAVSGNHLLRS